MTPGLKSGNPGRPAVNTESSHTHTHTHTRARARARAHTEHCTLLVFNFVFNI